MRENYKNTIIREQYYRTSMDLDTDEYNYNRQLYQCVIKKLDKNKIYYLLSDICLAIYNFNI